MMKSKVCAVVVTYNRVDMLKDAIESLSKQTVNLDILIVNNGSTDGTSEYLETLTNVKIINQDNVGGAGGFFTGIKYACEHGYDFAWIMDDDVLPELDSLQILLDDYNHMSAKENVGFICSSIISEEYECANVPVIDKRTNVTGYPDWGKYLKEGIVRVESATFVSVLIPCSIVNEVGLPYREYFIWGDDTEYTLRITKRYKGFLSGKSIVKHRRIGGALDIQTFQDRKRIMMYRKMIRNNTLNKRLYSNKKGLFKWMMVYSMLSMKLLLKGNLLKSRVVMSGLLDGLFFNPKTEFPKK